MLLRGLTARFREAAVGGNEALDHRGYEFCWFENWLPCLPGEDLCIATRSLWRRQFDRDSGELVFWALVELELPHQLLRCRNDAGRIVLVARDEVSIPMTDRDYDMVPAA